MKRLLATFILVALAAATVSATADELIMIRVSQPFPEAMNTLQKAIVDQGHTISRVQRVDVGLTAMGYETAEYRVVFFGHPDEMRELPARYPELVPYLPLKIVIFAERSESIVFALNPSQLGAFYADPPLKQKFAQWEKDVREIFDRVRAGSE